MVVNNWKEFQKEKKINSFFNATHIEIYLGGELSLKEEQFHQNLSLINDLRKVITYRYCKK